MSRPPSTVPPEGRPFPEISPIPDLPALEREVLEYWLDEGIFEDTLDPERADPHPIDGGLQESVVHDLPPVTRRFPSPTDLLAGFLHDTHCRLETMEGWVVPRPWVRCSHGIAAELEAQRRLGLADKAAIEAHGVDAFVTECSGVSGAVDVHMLGLLRRQGHWLSFDEGFDPRIPHQIASVWWAFETLHEKGLVYEGTGLAPFSESLGTPLAPFEVRFAADGLLRSPYDDGPVQEREVQGWFLKLDPIRQKLKDRVKSSVWFPGTVREDLLAWIAQAGDWCLSRDRYWGTPVPVWRSEQETRILGSVDELGQLLGDDVPSDFHRGVLDELELPSASGGPPLRRVPQVLDAWFDAACMPFARFCYPEAATDHFESRHPAGFTTQSHRHVRGWWFVLTVLSAALFDEPAVLNVIGHAEVLGEDGQELGELSPKEVHALLDHHGSDPLRWSLLVGGASHQTARLPSAVPGTLRLLWGLLDLFCRSANDSDLAVTPEDWPERPEHALDRWLLTKLHRRCSETNKKTRFLDYGGACEALADLVEDIVWWRGQTLARLHAPPSEDPEAWRPHLVTLHEILVTGARMLAPFAPFVAELVYLSLSPGRSVHLERWPDLSDLRTFSADEEQIDRSLAAT